MNSLDSCSVGDMPLSPSGQVLEGFAQQKGVWRYCVHFIQHSKNEHMLMYSLNLLEVGQPHSQTPIPTLRVWD